MVMVQSSFSVMLLLPDSVETERIKVTNFNIVEELGDTIAVIVDGFVCGISKSFFEMSSLPLHQHDSLYHRKPEFINGTLDLHLDSVTLRVIKLTGLPSGYTGDSCLILKNGVPSIISASSYRVMIGAAPALHQHDSLYFRKDKLTDGSTGLWLDSLNVRQIMLNGASYYPRLANNG